MIRTVPPYGFSKFQKIQKDHPPGQQRIECSFADRSGIFKKPVFIGDTVKAVATITKKYTKEGKSGVLQFLDVDTKVYNQKDEVVTDGEAKVIVM